MTGVHLNSARNVINRTTSLPGANTLGRYNVGDVESWAIKRSTTRMTRTETTQDKKSARPRSIQRFETQDPEENKAGLLEISGRYSNT